MLIIGIKKLILKNLRNLEYFEGFVFYEIILFKTFSQSFKNENYHKFYGNLKEKYESRMNVFIVNINVWKDAVLFVN